MRWPGTRASRYFSRYIAKDQMLEIFGGGFVTRETASLALDFLAFHVNYQYYCWLQFTFQFLPEGGIAAKSAGQSIPVQKLWAPKRLSRYGNGPRALASEQYSGSRYKHFEILRLS